MADRVLVIGLDSAPLRWVRQWAGEGRLPNLRRLMAHGASGMLRTVNPPLTPAAWSSLVTGMLPAKHGVFDHIHRRPGTYDVAPTNSLMRAGQPVWRIISEHGGTVGVVNVPETYPPHPVRGFFISGMDTPSDDSEFAYPASLKDELREAIGGYQVFGTRSKENLDRSIAGMHQTIPMRARASRYLWETYRPDFMITVFMETDVVQHKCWKYLDTAHPEHAGLDPREIEKYRQTIPDVYARIDSALGHWLDSLDDDVTLIVVSDHGAGPLNKFLHLNNWLVREGFMHFKPTALARVKHAAFRLGLTPSNVFDALAKLRLGLVDGATNRIKSDMARNGRTTLAQRLFLSWADVDWSRTQAYTLGGNYTGVYVNLHGREPQGCVMPGLAYEAVRDRLTERLMRWTDSDTGRPVVERVYPREALHCGPFADRAPDVIFDTVGEAYVGFGGHEFAGNALMAPSALFNGHHRMDGMVLLAGRDVRPGPLGPHCIVDIAPTVLHLLGHSIPAAVDGKVIEPALAPDFLKRHPVRWEASAEAQSGAVPAAYSAQDEDRVLSRLADLGYA